MKKISFVISAGVVAALLVACNSSAQKTNLTVQEFEKGITQKNIQVLDVRTAGEYQSGHLANAFLADWTNEQEFTERVKSLDKSKPVYTYCLSGARSSAAADWLNKNGFTAYNLAGGINAWARDNKPLEAVTNAPQMTMAVFLASIPKDKTVLVDFSAVWCPPCKKMEPVLDELQNEQGSKFILLKIDGAVQTNLCKELNVEGFPSFIIYKEGKPVWRKQGIVEKSEFVSQL